MESPRVLFVSKPIAPPFNDGTKCLVRDVALNLRRFRGEIMTAEASLDLRPAMSPEHPGLTLTPIYGAAGAFTPTLAANARAALFLFARARADVWHFAFAPNPRTSQVGRAARFVRRVPVIQTIASAPREFDPSLFFGDVLVAQSNWTHDRVVAAYGARHLRMPRTAVIPPPIAVIARPSEGDVARLRAELWLPLDATVFVYPGDLEVSRGAETVASAVPAIVARIPSAVVVFACRAKTARAPEVQAALAARLDPRHVRFAGETNLLALFATTSVVLFPVDDLFGKVDLPIALLEAMRLGVPIVALNEGPLLDLDGVARVDKGDATALARAAVDLAENTLLRGDLIAAARRAVSRRFDASVVAAAYEALYESVLRLPGAGGGDGGDGGRACL